MEITFIYVKNELAFCDRAYRHPDTWRCEKFPEVKYPLLRQENLNQLPQHMEDILDYEEDGTPIRVKDLCYYTKDEDIHATFRRELVKQLTPQLSAGLGIDLDTVDVPEYMGEIRFWTDWQYNLDGWSYARAGLRLCEFGGILIRWRSNNPDMPYLYLKDPVFPKSVDIELCTERHGIEQVVPHWDTLDPNKWIKEIKPFLSKQRRKTREQRQKRYEEVAQSFLPHIQNWPDLLVRLHFLGPMHDSHILRAENACLDMVEKWENEGVFVHDFEVKRVDFRTVEIFADFGNCDPEYVLPTWLGTLHERFDIDAWYWEVE